MTEIIRAHTNDDIQQIVELATEIWTEHYTSIIGTKQVTYMLEKFQSFQAIKEQILEGVYYDLLLFNNIPVGYTSFYKKDNSLFISKLYVLDQFRGKRIGKTALEYLENKSGELNCDSISLTVNKNNTKSIKVYQKMGFKILDSIVIDIGNGFVMDDYLMEKIKGVNL